MTTPASCLSYTPPLSGEFPFGYCVWQNPGSGSAPIPVDPHCIEGFGCEPHDDEMLTAAMRDTFDGECFNLTCSPMTTMIFTAMGALAAGLDSVDQDQE